MIVLIIAILAVGVVIARFGMAISRLHQSNVRSHHHHHHRGPGLP